MGNQKQKWTTVEEEALLAGVAKHGTGKWKNIIKDPDFAPSLTNRSNIDLKDKWRNLSISTGEKSRTSKIKSIVAAHSVNDQNSTPATSIRHNSSSDDIMDSALNKLQDKKNASRYNAMIFEALSTMRDVDGSDIGAILNFIEKRHEVPNPANFRRSLSTRLRRLVLQGKLEKVQNGYKIREETPLKSKTPSPKQEDVRVQQWRCSGLITETETLQDVADTAAYRVADSENKMFLAAEAVKESERTSKMAEDTESMLQIVEDVYEQCNSKNT